MSRSHFLSTVYSVLAFLCTQSGAEAELQYGGMIVPPTELNLTFVRSTTTDGSRAQLAGNFTTRPVRQLISPEGGLGSAETLPSFAPLGGGGSVFGGNLVGTELVAVGYTYFGADPVAARWNTTGAPTRVGPPVSGPDWFSYAFAIAQNGTITGSSGPADGPTCCGWVQFPDGSVSSLPGLTPGVPDERGPRAISDDGSIIVGGGHNDRALYWTVGSGNRLEAHNRFDPLPSGLTPAECLDVASANAETIALCTDSFTLGAYRLLPDRAELVRSFGSRSFGGITRFEDELLVGSSAFGARLVNGEAFLVRNSDIRDLAGNVVLDLNAVTGFQSVQLVTDGLFSLGDDALGIVFDGRPGLDGLFGTYVAMLRVVPEPGTATLAILCGGLLAIRRRSA